MENVGIISRLVTTLFIAILSLIITVQARCPECTKLDIDNTKIACQYLANTLVDADTYDTGTYDTGAYGSAGGQNATHVCRTLHELMLCIADKTPQCLETLGQKYKSYRMSPWMCKLTADQTILYQERHENGCKQHVDKLVTTTVVQSNVAEVYQSNTSNPNSCNLLNTRCWPLQYVVVVTILILQILIYS